MDIQAGPASFMMARISAKSRLTRPGTVMTSAMACDCMAKDFIRHLESAINAGLVIRKFQQSIIGDDNQGIDFGDELADAFFGYLHTAIAFKSEGLGNGGDGQGARSAWPFQPLRDSTGTRATAHTGGQEDHIRARLKPV